MAITTLASPPLPSVERRPALPAGFVAGGTTAGIKASGRPDLALIVATGGPAAAAAVFTPNAFAAAPVKQSRANLAATSDDPRGGFGFASAVISTSGCANAATGAAGDADQEAVGRLVAGACGIDERHVLHLSTGIIGTRLPLDRVEAGVGNLYSALSGDDAGLRAAAEALRTTDSVLKAATTTLVLPAADGEPVTVTITGIAKGVGMIHPNMATMLSVVLTDAAAAPEVLWSVLRPAAARTWDQLSVDGDSSTNDTVFVMASGTAANAALAAGSHGAMAFQSALEAVARDLARQQAADGEGATILITASVTGAVDDADARAVARAVISSSLVKAAAHGKDPNWGRIAGAAGNATTASAAVLEAAGLAPDAAAARASQPAQLDPDRLRIAIAGHLVFDGSQGGPLDFDRAAARAAMDAAELLIELDLGLGDGIGEAFGCDLTQEYVIENSEYTT
ncbi:MAG TPA: bifunctional ornithine acetyltransferase/N-acetylglutamate synthase [Candidatus Limnocylindrales bacterium]|nr:bifunctional ornithine acetyltransferase/N-acetylglutamate synthase [Candidatus Limnocylindrales bacterium]